MVSSSINVYYDLCINIPDFGLDTKYRIGSVKVYNDQLKGIA